MHRYGISIYPGRGNKQQDFAYMKLAASYGFTRVFTCLLSLEVEGDELFVIIKEYIQEAHKLGFLVSVDTNRTVFEKLHTTPSDLRIFHEMGVDILRLDTPFHDYMNCLLTQNPYHIQIEFNGSLDSHMDHYVQQGAQKEHMRICHNFYPQLYTGLSWHTFQRLSERWAKIGVPVGAFVSSIEKGTFGPWDANQGLPTLERHRKKPLELQVKELLACGYVDDIIIGNAYASESELQTMAEIDTNKVQFKIIEADGLSDKERNILYGKGHFSRPDASSYLMRSSAYRMHKNNSDITYRRCAKKTFQFGDVVIVNERLPHYAGECEIVLKEIENDGTRNYVASIVPEEHDLCMLSAQHVGISFGFVAKK